MPLYCDTHWRALENSCCMGYCRCVVRKLFSYAYDGLDWYRNVIAYTHSIARNVLYCNKNTHIQISCHIRGEYVRSASIESAETHLPRGINMRYMFSPRGVKWNNHKMKRKNEFGITAVIAASFTLVTKYSFCSLRSDHASCSSSSLFEI